MAVITSDRALVQAAAAESVAAETANEQAWETGAARDLCCKHGLSSDMMARITSGCGLKLACVWSGTPIRDTSCCCRPLTGAPCLRPGPRPASAAAAAAAEEDGEKAAVLAELLGCVATVHAANTASYPPRWP